VIVM